MRDSDPITRLTAARFDGPQALYTEAVRLLSERPALPDDLAGLVARLRDGCNLQQRDGERSADAIEALAAENARLSAREPQCAAVKPLVWTVRHGQYEHWQADGIFPKRGFSPDYIIGSNEGKTEWYWCNFGEWDNSPLPSEEAAKAAAQADYEARILSAITIRPEAEVRAEAWAAAIEAAAVKCIPWSLACSEEIRALTTNDASAALDRIKAEARVEGMREAAGICEGDRQPDYICGGDEQARRYPHRHPGGAQMSDAPERIWLDGDATIDEGVFPRCFATPKPASDPPMEFVRADLHAAAIAQAERAEAALALLHSRASDLLFCYRHGNGLDGWHKAADGLDDAINKIEATKGGAA